MAYDKQQVIDKVRKILDRADTTRGATQEEAATAAAMAQRMLEDYKLTMTDIEFAEMKELDPIKQWYINPKDLGIKRKATRELWSEQLAAVVARAHMCEILVHPRSNAFTLVGREQDAAVAAFMYHFLYTNCEKIGVHEYAKEYRRCYKLGNVTLARGFRDAFRQGFIQAVNFRYDEQHRARTKAGAGTALVRITTELEAAKQYIEDLKESGVVKKKGTALRGRRSGHELGNAAGRQAGRAVDLNANGIKGGSSSTQLGRPS